MKFNLADKAISKLVDVINYAMEYEPPQQPWPFPTGDIEIKPITQQATEEGIRFIHAKDTSQRCTIAYRPVSSRGKMMEIAVAYVHPKDQYNKKHGATLAAERFFNGQTVVMPVRDKDNYVTYRNMVEAFTGMSW